MRPLPAVDVHSLVVDVPRERLWASTLRTVGRSFGGRAPGWYAAVVGCEPVRRSEVFPAPRSTLPGFRVVEHRQDEVLDLEGRHLFSVYRLRFEASTVAAGRSELSARSFARFPGPHGALYRTAVVATGIHSVAVQRLLRTVGRDALRAHRA